ncbi:hypothetical protein B0O80DRAFT_240697 [Mortierella sp. GBAus27b]|nr:hypothetical protein B0O80DRAFT_240697 [Mortierella sp. GBAus27b]
MPKTAALKKPGKESKRGSGKSASFLERLASSVKGASIVSADQIPAIVDLMALANSPTEKRNVLNAILNTKNTLILRRFMVTDGPNKIRGWVAESKRETGSAEHKELLQKMIATFKKLPYDKQNLPDPKLRSTIRQLAVDKLGHHGTDLVKDTTELTNSWCKLSGETPLGLARSTPAVHSEGSRKKPRLEDILFSNREDLPSFTKAKSVPGKVTIAKDTTPKDTATRDSIAKESAAKNTANKEAASKPQSRIRENADFFKEIGQQSSSSTTYSRDTSTNREGSRPARGAPSPTSSQPGNKNITGIGTNNVGPRTNAPPTIPAAVPFNFRASVPLPSTPIPILRPTPNATPTPITRGPDFNPMSSQHNKAWEAAKKLQQEQLSGRKKTVRFNDSELVQIRIFERFQAELYEDEDDDDDDDEDEMEIQDDYGNGNDEFSPSPPSSPLLSLPLGFGPGFETASHMAPYRSSRPAFIMPENRMLDLMAGMYWTSPRPLHISDQHAPDDSEGEHNEGAYSIEKNVQAKREEGIPAAVYRTIADIPPSPAEPGEEPQGEVDLPRPIQLFNGGADFSSAFVHTMVVVCGYLVNKTPTGHR